MERKWEVLPDARDWEIERLTTALNERDREWYEQHAENEKLRKVNNTLLQALQHTLLYGRPMPEMEAQEHWSWARHVEVAGGDLAE